MFGGPANTPSSVTCAQVFANFVAFRGSSQFATGCGGIQLSGPTGGAAYGIPKNSYTPFSTNPRTGPSTVRTTGPSFRLSPRSSAMTAVENTPDASNEPRRSARATPFGLARERRTFFSWVFIDFLLM